MPNNPQVTCETTINAPAATIWSIIADSHQLPRWMPNVSETLIVSEQSQQVGEVRACDVSLSGRGGSLRERCTEFVPHERLAFRVENDSFGMRFLLRELGYVMLLRPTGEGTTEVRLEYRYVTRGFWGRLLDRLLIQPSWRPLCGDMVTGLKNYVESGAA